MKIMQVLPALDSGGVERGTLEIARALVLSGHESVVVSAGGRLVKQLEAEGSRHIHLDAGKKSIFTVLKISSARKTIKEESPDILHLRSRLPAWIFYQAWKKCPIENRPVLLSTFHGLYSTNKYSAIMVKPAQIIAVSHWVKKHILENYQQASKRHITVIARGIDHDFYPHVYKADKIWLDSWYQEYPETLGKRIILLPGRVSRLKGQLAFVDLMQELVKKHDNIIGVIVGGLDKNKQNYLDEIKHKMTVADLNKHVLLTGHRDDLREIMSLSAVTLNLSTKPEAFGRTVLESLALGTPAFAWNCGGSLEVLNKIWPKGLITMGAMDELSQKIGDLLGQSYVADIPPFTDYSLNEMCESTLSLYAKLLCRQAS